MGGACGIIGSTSTSVGLSGLYKDRVTFFTRVCVCVCMYLMYACT